MTMYDEYLAVRAPRRLRVRASLQMANTRLPARSFVLVMGCVLVGGIAVARGADLIAVAQWLSLVAGVGIVLLEGSWWGYSTWAFVRLVAAHLSRPGQLELERPEITLPPETATHALPRRPRWQHEPGGTP